jgi:hypothetical protein
MVGGAATAAALVMLDFSSREHGGGFGAIGALYTGLLFFGVSGAVVGALAGGAFGEWLRDR